MPKNHTMSTGTKTPFRRELNANVPMSVTVMVDFYRRELGKLHWKEEGKGHGGGEPRRPPLYRAGRPGGP